ncbi:hypothetical protein SprV_0802507200 [Sparganum proliferum]
MMSSLLWPFGSSLTLRYLKLSSSSSFSSSSSSSSSSYSSSSSQQQSIPGPVLSWSRKQLGNILVFPEFMDKPSVIMPDVAGLDDVADFTSPRVTIRGSGSTQLHPFSPPATETEYWRSTYPFHALANRVEPSSEFVSSSTSPAVIMPDVAGLDDVADFTSPRVTIRGSGSTQLHPFSPPATETEYWRSTYPFHALANRVEPSSEFVSSSTSPGSSLTLRYLKLSSSSSFSSSSSSSSSSYSSSSSQQQSIPGPVLSWSGKQLGNILVFPEFMDKPCDSATSFTPDSIECRSPKPTTSRAISSA